MKRSFDIVMASVMLVLALPLLFLSAIAVRLTSKGPVFFAQERWGRDGVQFRCLKFRTMVPDAEDWLLSDPDLKAMHKQNGFKLGLDQDPRVTGVGQLLRKTHLDELPQVINVIRGEMSIIGPRPIVEEELEWYGDDKREYLSVKPGVFGAWTAQGRRRVHYPDRALVELEYVRNPTILRGTQILLKHIPVLMVGLIQGVRFASTLIYKRIRHLLRIITGAEFDRIA
jgi:lipopolysaccharide/colanic/teichoic acid biosynthesis glycosyltransferase